TASAGSRAGRMSMRGTNQICGSPRYYALVGAPGDAEAVAIAPVMRCPETASGKAATGARFLPPGPPRRVRDVAAPVTRGDTDGWHQAMPGSRRRARGRRPRLAHPAGTACAGRGMGRLVPVHAGGRAGVRALRPGGAAPGTGGDGVAAVPVAGAGAVPVAHLAEAGGHRRGELGAAVPAVRLGGAARAGGD